MRIGAHILHDDESRRRRIGPSIATISNKFARVCTSECRVLLNYTFKFRRVPGASSTHRRPDSGEGKKKVMLQDELVRTASMGEAASWENATSFHHSKEKSADSRLGKLMRTTSKYSTQTTRNTISRDSAVSDELGEGGGGGWERVHHSSGLMPRTSVHDAGNIRQRLGNKTLAPGKKKKFVRSSWRAEAMVQRY